MNSATVMSRTLPSGFSIWPQILPPYFTRSAAMAVSWGNAFVSAGAGFGGVCVSGATVGAVCGAAAGTLSP